MTNPTDPIAGPDPTEPDPDRLMSGPDRPGAGDRAEAGYPASGEEIEHAEQAGAAAAAAGSRPDVCPYRAGETERDRFLRLVWLRGYHHARAERIGGHTTLDDPDQD